MKALDRINQLESELASEREKVAGYSDHCAMLENSKVGLESALAQPIPQPVAGPGVIEAAKAVVVGYRSEGCTRASLVYDLESAIAANDPAAPVREALEAAAKWCEPISRAPYFNDRDRGFDMAMDACSKELRRRAGLLGGAK